MTNPDDLVRVAAGDLVRIELYQRALKDAGIASEVVGDNLEAGLGSVIPGSIELWTRGADAGRAKAAIARAEAEHGRGDRGEPPHGHPVSDPAPDRPVVHGPHTHYNADPHS